METSAFLIEDEQEEMSRLIYRTGIECARCGDDVHYTDEVFLISIVRPTISVEGVIYEMLQADDGDFLYEPRTMNLECWEEAVEELRERMEDIPPILDLRAVLECSICESGIRTGESVGLIQFGEVHCSQRRPEDASTNTFETYDHDPQVICLSCIRLFNEDVNCLWEGDVQEGDECKEGTYLRCWREGCEGVHDCKNKTWDFNYG